MTKVTFRLDDHLLERLRTEVDRNPAQENMSQFIRYAIREQLPDENKLPQRSRNYSKY